MYYIIMDLEWNNAYSYKLKRFMNEIIEIGAVKLDGNLNFVDDFSCLIKSKIGKKLRGNVKRLTNISNEDVRNGVPFSDAVSDFTDWVGTDENVILTWGDGDIRVFIENFMYFKNVDTLPFLTNYMDIQRYFEIKNQLPKSQQISLSNAAELVGVNVDSFNHHRALDDSMITAECMRRVFDESDFFERITKCDETFYERLRFKPHAISNINHPLVDKSLLCFKCDKCGSEGVPVTEWRYSNQFFRAIYRCPVCNYNARVAVRFKKYFDRMETKKTVSVLPDKKNGK